MSIQSRFPLKGQVSSDNTDRIMTSEYQPLPILQAGHNLTITTEAAFTYVTVEILANCVVFAKTGKCKIGDRLTIQFNNNWNEERTVVLDPQTFRAAGASLKVNNLYNASISFIFDGNTFVEIGRGEQTT